MAFRPKSRLPKMRGGATPPRNAAPRPRGRPRGSIKVPKILKDINMKTALGVGAALSPFMPGAVGQAARTAKSIYDIVNSGKENTLFKDFTKTAGKTSLKEGHKIFSNEEGLGTIKTTFDGIVPTHDGAKIYKLKESFHDGSKDSKLKLAKTMYGSNSNILYTTQKTAYARLYAYAGLNTKGIFQPYRSMNAPPTYNNIDTQSVANSQNGGYFTGELLMDTANMLKASLLPIGSLAGALTEMPTITSGDEDYYFPLQSFNMKMRITNTDAYLPCMVKLYVLRAKKNLGSGGSPAYMWFDLDGTTQDKVKLNSAYVNYTTSEAIAGCISGYTSQNLHPQATPLMSQNFADSYEILKIHNQKLGPSDSLEYDMTKHYGRCHSAQDYLNDQQAGVYIRQDSIHYIIEFQGLPCPYYKTTAVTPFPVDYSAMAHSSFAKIRVTCDKTFIHSLPLSNASSLFLPTGTNYSPTFVSSKRMPLKVYDDTAPYTSFSTTAAASVYVIPLITQQTVNNARPLINDPPA